MRGESSLRRIPAAGPPRGRQGFRQRRVSDHAPDFFNQINFFDQIRPERRDSHRQRLRRSVDCQPQPPQAADDLGFVKLRTENGIGPGRTKGDHTLRQRVRVEVYAPQHDFAPRKLRQQVAGAFQRDRSQRGVYKALIPIRCLGRQPQRFRGPAHRAGVEVGRL